MEWSLNKLEKTGITTYIPGNPGSAGSPGSPYQPGYSYFLPDQNQVSTLIYSYLPPDDFRVVYTNNGYTVSLGTSRVFNGVRCTLAGVQRYGTAPNQAIIYVYNGPRGGTTIYVDPVPAVPPTPAVPVTPTRLAVNYRLGWNSGAIGPGVLLVNKAVAWRFNPGAVGAAVGLTNQVGFQGQTYAEMRFSAIAISGLYSIYVGSTPITAPRLFNASDVFAITHAVGGVYSVLVNGAVMYQTTIANALVPDSSLYSAYDAILDASLVDITAVPENAGIAATTITSASAVAYKPVVFGPGTALGIIGASTQSKAIAGQVTVNGTVFTNAEASTITSVDAVAYKIPSLGPGTTLGIASGSTVTAAVCLVASNNIGIANVSFEKMIAAGATPEVFNGWTGHSSNSFRAYLPELEADGDSGFIVPGIGIADTVMVSMIAGGHGVAGGVSTSADMSLKVMLALGSGNPQGDPVYDYAQADSYLQPLYSFGTDFSISQFNVGFFNYDFFTITATGHESGRNTAFLRSRDAFSFYGQSGHQMKGTLSIEVYGEGVGANVGWFLGEIGYG